MTRLGLGLWAVFAVLHLAGGRDDVAFLSGTVPATAAALAAGLAYALAWFAAVLVAPVLVASGLVMRALPAMARWRLDRRPVGGAQRPEPGRAGSSN